MSHLDDIFSEFDSELQSIDAKLNDSSGLPIQSLQTQSFHKPLPCRQAPKPATSASVLSDSVAARMASISNKVSESIAASKRALAVSEARYPSLFSKSQPVDTSPHRPASSGSKTLPKRPPPPAQMAQSHQSCSRSSSCKYPQMEPEQDHCPSFDPSVINFDLLSREVSSHLGSREMALTFETALEVRKNIMSKWKRYFGD
ncbi:hypothetical protein P9112_011389 [Eukaryota sp. TZLM1-RC]